MRPQWISEPVGSPVSGRSVLLAIDVSASMRQASLGTELAINVVRRTAQTFIAQRAGDQIGLVLFGSRPYLQAPLSFDARAVSEMVNEASIGLAGEGTALGDAIGLAITRLKGRHHAQRVLVLLTDGANTGGELMPLEAAELAKHHGVRIYTIGVGAVTNATAGEGLDEPTLTAISDLTGGRYFFAGDDKALDQIYRELDQLEPIAQHDERLRPAADVYFYPVAAAWLLALSTMLRRSRTLRNERAGRPWTS